MATTTNGWTYPVGTDRVTDGDNAIKSVADTIEARIGHGATSYGVATVSGFSGPDVAQSQAVTFPAGRFTGAPSVMLTINASNPFACHPPTHQGITASGFTIWAARHSGAANVSVAWLAVQR